MTTTTETNVPSADTKEGIQYRMQHSDRWLYRGLKAIYDRQTEDEKSAEVTNKDNKMGFNGTDAHILTSYAKFYEKTGFLTPKQREYARKKMMKYAGQLLKIAKGKL